MNRLIATLLIVVLAVGHVTPAASSVSYLPRATAGLIETQNDANLAVVYESRRAEERAGLVKEARVRGGAAAVVVPPDDPRCPKGLTNVAFDACDQTSLTAEFKDPNLIATYAVDIIGNPQTIHHPPPYNVAGQDVGVGQTTTTGKEDPRAFSVIGTATITGTNTLNIATITNLGTPKAGMWAWDVPAQGTQYYAGGQAPKIVSCTPNTGGFLYQCLLNRTVTNRGGFHLYASLWNGCVTLVQGGTGSSHSNGSSGAAFDKIYCDFRNSTDTAKAEINNITFASTGGHNGTILVGSSNSSSASSGEIVIDNSYIALDASTYGQTYISAPVSAPNIKLTVKNSRCYGGNAGAPLSGPFTFPNESLCINWDSGGDVAHGRNQVLLQNLYVDNWSGRAISLQLGKTDSVVQNAVFNRIALNCGDYGDSNGCHGTLISAGTTFVGSSGSIKIKNVVGVLPYGQRDGVITGAFSLQGGVGSAATGDIEFSGVVVLSNTGYNPGQPIVGSIAQVHRIGAVSNLKIQHLYSNSPGTTSCFFIGGDMQSNQSALGAMTANTGLRTSIMNWSGIVGSPGTVPFERQWFVDRDGSNAKVFRATLADNGNGTSTLQIVGTPPSTLPNKLQIGALQMADPVLHPTLIVSQTDADTYIVSNGSGSGETRAEQQFVVAQIAMPFGSINPNTGQPTTSSITSNATSLNGTWLFGGERTYTAPNPGSPANQNWVAYAPGLGNSTTVVAESNNLWMLDKAGDAGKITLDGLQLDGGVCPVT